MDYIFNKEKITKLFADFQLVTGIPSVLYDASLRSVASSGNLAPYCMFINAHKEPFKHCSMCNIENLKVVSDQKGAYVYTCHAGIVEVIKPIFYGNEIIAYIQLGQFRDEQQQYSSVALVETAAKTYQLDPKKLVELYTQLPIFSTSQLNALLHILDTLITALWEQSLIYADRSMLSVKIEQYLSAHLATDLQVEDVCKEFFISRNALYRLFKKQFHTSIKAYILEKRMQQAKKILIQQPNLPISEVATLCGFSDYNYFIRAFKKQYEVTPLQFKKSAALAPRKNNKNTL